MYTDRKYSIIAMIFTNFCNKNQTIYTKYRKIRRKMGPNKRINTISCNDYYEETGEESGN